LKTKEVHALVQVPGACTSAALLICILLHNGSNLWLLQIEMRLIY